MIKRKVKDIDPMNTNGEFHGYQEWCWLDGEINYRGNRKNGEFIGYQEHHRDENPISDFISRDSTTEYFIR